MYLVFGLYPATGMSPVVELRQLTLATSAAYSCLFVMQASTGGLSFAGSLGLGTAWIGTLLAAPLGRVGSRILCSKFGWWGRRAVILGDCEVAGTVFHKLQARPELGLRPVGIVDEPYRYWRKTSGNGEPYLGAPERIGRYPWSPSCGVGNPRGARRAAAAREVDRFAFSLPILVIVPELQAAPTLWNRTFECAGQTGIYVRGQLLSPWARCLKRTMDVVLVIVGGLLLLPLVGLIGLAIKALSPGPVFYAHERIGQQGRRFRAWKFRTMVPDADKVLDDYFQTASTTQRGMAEPTEAERRPARDSGDRTFPESVQSGRVAPVVERLTG